MRLLPQRHDHDDQGAADAQPASDRTRGSGGTALQSLPLRRAYGDHSRGDACRRYRARGTRLMSASGSSDDNGDRQGTLTVVRPAAAGTNHPFETFIKITADGSVTAFNGHVDLGTGIRTAL